MRATVSPALTCRQVLQALNRLATGSAPQLGQTSPFPSSVEARPARPALFVLATGSWLVAEVADTSTGPRPVGSVLTCGNVPLVAEVALPWEGEEEKSGTYRCQG